MPDSNSSKKKADKKTPSVSFESKPQKPVQRYRYSYTPMSFYWLKDFIREFVSKENFPDALAILIDTFSVSITFPFYPTVILIPLLLLTFAIAMLSPLGGLMLMLFETLAMFIYQAPLLAWILTIFVSVSLLIGYNNYRTITFVYALMMLPLSYLGQLLEIPAFMLGTLFIGFKRAMASAIVVIILIVMLSGMTGIQNSAPIVYNATGAFNSIVPPAAGAMLTPSKPAATFSSFFADAGTAWGNFFSLKVGEQLFVGFGAAILSIFYQFQFTIIQLVVWLIVIFAMTNFVIESRSGFKGTIASTFAFIILGVYAVLSYATGSYLNRMDVISFILTPILIFLLEYSNVSVVRALEVMKQDFLGKFGDSFQDLTSSVHEKLDDVANYDQTKKELREAVLAPIEHRAISGAYNVKPAKGILLFGPPGTGKTLIMRALSNEIRAKFFYVKTSSLVSPYPGQSAQDLSKIFNTVRKNTPAVLFFDEIDGIASKRDATDADSSRTLISTLLTEMDGFEKMEGVVIVGSTNVPNLLDPGIMRPGRFDKIIYMPLPEKSGRAKIFAHYLKSLPIGEDINYNKLADLTNRYSGADIKNICNEVARQVADEAVRQRKVLQINMADFVSVIKGTKPSTSLSTLEKYNQFRIDYERRMHPELSDKEEYSVKLSDVIGLEDAKKALYEAIEIPILHPNLVRKYDVNNIKGIMLFGPPGTGKTMLIKAVASELDGVKLIIISGSDIAKNGLENALSEIRETFNRAKENTPSIIFIDEMDSLLPSRNDSSEFSVHMTSEFLQQLDGIRSASGIVLVGATNRPDHIDQAILRPGRIDRFIFVHPPNLEDRARIFEENLSRAPLESKIDYKELAERTSGYTGADIANICRQAKLTALEENVSTSSEKKISMADILKVIDATKPSAPSSTLGPYMNFISMYGGR